MRTLLALILALTTSLQGQDALTLMRQGDVHDVKYQANEALKYYLPAEKMQPDNAALLVKIARQYVFRMTSLATTAEKLASAKTALSYSTRAATIDPKSCEAQLGIAISLGRMAQLQGNKEKVAASRPIKEAAEKAAKLDPRNDYAWHILGRWHQGIAGANSFLLAIARLVYGDIPEASNDKAVEYFKKAISLRPDRLIHQIELGRTYAQMGKADEARKLIEKGLAMPNTEKDDAETKERGRKTLEKLED